MNRSEKIRKALDEAWHPQTAEASLNRWLQLCEEESWGEIPGHIDKLIAVFGASWYLTRFIFYRGRKSAELIDSPELAEFDGDTLKDFLSRSLHGENDDHRFEWLRSLKNQAMLQILTRRLTGNEALEQNEAALTELAAATLDTAMTIAGPELDTTESGVAVLGMGRMAGHEMTYGSDLDLIFLYRTRDDDFRSLFSEKVRVLLRNMSINTATGVLYDVDMRLRPHGTSGALVTSLASFLEYHSGNRDTWERQMMTRCRPIIDRTGFAREAMAQINTGLYQEAREDRLSDEIRAMRGRVENELGTQKGRIDIKRGRGGIMDIDFLCHYLQLEHGGGVPGLRTTSTRTALRAFVQHELLPDSQAECLLDCYDFFKSAEAVLRLFDMKPVSSFPLRLAGDHALVRAMGYRGEKAASRFLTDYQSRAGEVRAIFDAVLGTD